MQLFRVGTVVLSQETHSQTCLQVRLTHQDAFLSLFRSNMRMVLSRLSASILESRKTVMSIGRHIMMKVYMSVTDGTTQRIFLYSGRSDTV